MSCVWRSVPLCSNRFSKFLCTPYGGFKLFSCWEILDRPARPEFRACEGAVNSTYKKDFDCLNNLIMSLTCSVVV